MTRFEVIEEISLALGKCTEQILCESCPYCDACYSVFGKNIVSEEVRELAQQCKSFNEFARANRK